MPQGRPPGLKAAGPAPTSASVAAPLPSKGAAVKKVSAAGIAASMSLIGTVSLFVPALLFLPIIKNDLCLDHAALVIAVIAALAMFSLRAVKYGGQIVMVSGMPA